MSVCTFFGHRDCPEHIRPTLENAMIDLIQNHGVNLFYVGNQGHFDAMAHGILKELSRQYPICYAVVLAYLPVNTDEDCSDTMFPEGLETVPKRFAIDKRNTWMLDHSDFVICYRCHNWGGAAKYIEMAYRRKKTVIEL